VDVALNVDDRNKHKRSFLLFSGGQLNGAIWAVVVRCCGFSVHNVVSTLEALTKVVVSPLFCLNASRALTVGIHIVTKCR